MIDDRYGDERCAMCEEPFALAGRDSEDNELCPECGDHCRRDEDNWKASVERGGRIT